MSEFKRGPSFTNWKMLYLLDVAGTDCTIQMRRPCKIQPNGPFTLTRVKGRGIGLEERLPDGMSHIISYAPYPPGSYYVREGTEAADDGCLRNTKYTCDDSYALDGWDNSIVPWQNVDGSPRKVDRLSAMYMPRNCARLRFDITGVRVEQFGEISREDAIAEGIERHPEFYDRESGGRLMRHSDFFNEVVIPRIYDGEVPADWWWVYEGTVSLIEEADGE